MHVSKSYLEVRHVSKSFRYKKALEDVSFTVDKGEYFVVLGPVGSGRTTLLKIIAGLVEPDSGDIVIDGKVVNGIPPEERGIGYMPPGYALFPHMTVWDNVAYGLWVRNLPEDILEKNVREALEMVGLLHRAESFPDELSGGQRQRIALARALASGAKILLLDEPFSALDAILAMEVRSELKELSRNLGLTVIHTTHNREEALAVADRILVLRRGMVEQIGRPEDVYRNPDTLFVASFVCDSNLLEAVVVDREENTSVLHVMGLGYIKVENDLNVGERVVVSINPLLLRIGCNININCVEGVVEAVSRSPVVSRIWLKCGSVTLKVDRPSHEVFSLQPGDRLRVSLPTKVKVYPYPEEGLVKAVGG